MKLCSNFSSIEKLERKDKRNEEPRLTLREQPVLIEKEIWLRSFRVG